MKRIYLKLNDRDWLNQLYTVEVKSTIHIAKLAGCSSGAVKSALRGHGIPIRDHPPPPPRRRPAAIIRDPEVAARLRLPAGVEVGI